MTIGVIELLRFFLHIEPKKKVPHLPRYLSLYLESVCFLSLLYFLMQRYRKDTKDKTAHNVYKQDI
jgi:hypothetical protein